MRLKLDSKWHGCNTGIPAAHTFGSSFKYGYNIAFGDSDINANPHRLLIYMFFGWLLMVPASLYSDPLDIQIATMDACDPNVPKPRVGLGAED